jgi:hypothetical protein
MPYQSRRRRRLGVTVLAAVVSSLPASKSGAAVTVWTGADGTSSWSDPNNWSNGEPGSASLVTINSSSSTVFNVTYDYAGKAVTLNSLTVDLTSGGGATNTLTIPADNLKSINELVGSSGAGSGGNGTINQTGGSNSPTSLYMGYNPTDTGTYSLSNDGSSLSASNEYVGFSGTGIFNQSGGTNTISVASNPEDNNYYFAIGYGSAANGTYNLSGGALLVSGVGMEEYVGDTTGTGTFVQTGGTHTVSGGDILSVGPNGNYSLDAGSLSVTGVESVGGTSGHTATFTQTGGTNSIATGGLELGFSSGLIGVYNLSGTATLTVTSSNEIIGENGIGTLTQTGGVNKIVSNAGSSNFMSLGYFSGSTGTFTLSGGSATIGPTLYVGGPGTSGTGGGSGVLTVSGTSSLTIGGTLTAFNTPGSAVNFSGGTIVASALNFNGTPTLLNWTGGTLELTPDVVFDPGAAATSTSAAFGSSLTLGPNQTLVLDGNQMLGGTKSFTLTLNAGSSETVNGTTTVNPGSTLNLNGGTFSTQALVNHGTLGLSGTMSGAMVNNASLLITGNTSLGNISGTGNLIVGTASTRGFLQLNSGSGTIAQSGLTINTGSTVDIANNVLQINYGSEADPASTIRSYLVSGYNADGQSGVWQGTGIISSVAAANPTGLTIGYADGGNAVDVADTGIAPGEIEIECTVPGDINLSGSVDLSDLIILANNFGETGSDWAEGDVNYDGNVDLSDLVIVASDFGASLSSIQASDFSDSFAAEWQLSLAEVHGAEVSVPEPASMALAVVATAGLLARIRNHKR